MATFDRREAERNEKDLTAIHCFRVVANCAQRFDIIIVTTSFEHCDEVDGRFVSFLGLDGGFLALIVHECPEPVQCSKSQATPFVQNPK